MDRNRTFRITDLASVLSMLLIAAVIFVFNFLPEKVGFYKSAADLDSFTPLLAPAFVYYLPGLNLWCGLACAYHIALLSTRRWTPALRWAQVALGFIGVFVLARIVFDAPFLPSANILLVRYLLASVVLAMVFTSTRRLNRLVNGRWFVFGPDPARE